MMSKRDRIIIGSDHGGFKLKEVIIEHLKGIGCSVDDLGCYSSESCDYPKIGSEVARRVGEENIRGILICGTGLGMSIVANRIPGIRAALCHDAYTAEMSRRHNDSNILVLGGRVTGESVAINIVDTWINTEFEGGRHQRRLDMIEKNNKY